jgi:hypothetical protein
VRCFFFVGSSAIFEMIIQYKMSSSSAEKRHALVYVVGNVLALFVARRVSTALETKRKEDGSNTISTPSNRRLAALVLAYYACTVAARLRECGSYILFEMLWGCNVSMLQACLGVFVDSPLLVGSAVTTVAIDQMCWYVDLLGYPLTGGKFIVGVTKYLIKPETGWARIYTSLHHLWFMPAFMWSLRNHGGVRKGSWTISCAVTAFLAVYCRALTPTDWVVAAAAGSKPGSGSGIGSGIGRAAGAGAGVGGIGGLLLSEAVSIPLNVNCAHWFWPDIEIPFLHAFNDRHPLLYMPYLVFVCNVVLNGPPYVFLRWLSKRLFGQGKRIVENEDGEEGVGEEGGERLPTVDLKYY